MLDVQKMANNHLTFYNAKDFAKYWSSSTVADDIKVFIHFRGLRSRHIVPFQGHESKVTSLGLRGAKMCKRKPMKDCYGIWSATVQN